MALQAGVAYNLMGEGEAGMGVDIGDCDNDGDFDLFVTNFSHETNTLYRNDAGRFKDVTTIAGLGQPSWRFLGFGANFLDYDSDGDLDLYVANGHVLDRIALFQPGVEYAEEHQLFRNDGTCRYTDVSAASGIGLPVNKSAEARPLATTTRTVTSTSWLITAAVPLDWCATRTAMRRTGPRSK